MASSSSSHQHDAEHLAFSGIEPDTKRRKVCESSRIFDVFINHRGPDSKETVAAHLYTSLQERGLRPFLDREEIELGDYFPSTLETAIRSASAHIAIFSKRYAQSAWCLAELVLMLESEAKIFPLFYGVKPWELRFVGNGVYTEAFTNYEKKGRYLEKLESWKKALHCASFFDGLEIDSAQFSPNSEEFMTLVLKVQKEVERKKPLFVAKHPVALHKLVNDFESQCLYKLVNDFENQCGLNIEGNDHSKIVGIFGMGGAGKTTLAKELFNRKRSNYMATCFLFDVREKSSRFGLTSLQAELLRHLFHESPPEFPSSEEGSNYVRDRLGSSRLLSFLIVVDDIDHVKQLDALCLMDMVNNSHNSLVIVTTRDVGVLTNAGITNRYNLRGLNRDDGRELFCWHSFGQRNPASGYENLVDAFIDVCGGLPLSLQVLGRHVYDRPVYYWELQLCKVRESLHQDIKDILKISFDALNTVEKQIFMDIACFFVDKCKNTAIRVWEGSGSGARYALETLKDRCLVEEGEGLDGLLWEEKPVVLKMHDHLRDMGREMSNELTSPPRHWSPEYHKSLETEGFQNILAQTKGRCFHSIYDRSVGSQITYFMGESEERGETSSSLLWLQLDLNCRELSSIPPWIPLQNLECLRISHGHLKRLWQSNAQAPSQLKELQIYQTTLEEFPNFLGISDNLQQVVLDAKDMPIKSWPLLESLRVYPRSLVLACSTLHGELACNNRGHKTAFKSSYFTSLVIRDFVKLSDELDLYNIGESTDLKCPLSNLEYLEINNQINVTKILISRNYCPKLLSLKIHDMSCLIEMNLLSVQTLNCLEINTCKNLKNLSETSNFRNLVEFNISQCPELEELGVVHLTCLQILTIKNCVRLKILSGLSNLRKLVKLDITECPELEELPCSGGLTCLTYISIFRCGKLMKIHLEDCENLEGIAIKYCEKLKNMTLPTTLFSFSLRGCKELQRVTAIGDLTKLRRINISECPELEELPSLARMRCLQEIKIDSCGKLEFEDFRLSGMKFLERITLDGNVKVKYFELDSCQNLETVTFGCENLRELKQLRIQGCPKLKELPSLSTMRCLQEIEIESCGNLKLECLCLSGMKYLESITLDRNLKVKYLELDRCRNLETIIFGCEELIELKIRGCRRLEELPSLSRMRLLHQIEIESCGKLDFESLCLTGMELLKSITLDRNVRVTYFELDSCQNLETVMFGSENLKELRIRGCPKLEKLPAFEGAVCLERVIIDGCEKLKNITVPSGVIKLYVKGCRELQSVAGIGDLRKLSWMNVIECPGLEELPSLDRMLCLREIEICSCGKLQFEFLCLSGMKFLERIKLDGNVKVKSFELESCQNLETIMFGCEKLVELKIRGCPKLDKLPAFKSLVYLERVIIDGCGKFKDLEFGGCQNLRSVSGNLELTKLYIKQCPELEELPSLSRMLCLEEIYIDSCEKMKKISLPSALINLYVKGCRELERLAGIGDLKKLTSMNVIACPELEGLPSLDRMPCLQEIKIDSCGKLEFEDFRLRGMKFLERITLDGNVLVKYFELDSCQNLETVTFGCENLKELRIQGCPKLEKLPAFKGAVCLERVIIDGCGNFNSLELDGCQNLRSVSGNFELTKLYINQCPELEELASLSSMRLLEEIKIYGCEKLQNLTLPSRFIRLHVWNCRHLQRISVTGDFMELATVSCTEEIKICDCEKLQNITLPSRLVRLYVWNCRDLQTISVTGDFMELATVSCTEEIKIYDCEKLQNITLPSRLVRLNVWNCRDLRTISVTGDFVELATVSCTEEITIYDCEKLQNITLPSRLIRLYVWNCRDLQTISVTGDFMELATVSCTEEIKIYDCEKLQNITLPSRLIRLHVWNCRDLQRISVTGDFMELATVSCTEEIKIYDCEKLQNITLPSRLIRLHVWNCRDLQRISVTGDFMELATVSCTEEIKIRDCEKLQNITLPSRLIRLYVWNCRDLQTISVTGDFVELATVSCTEEIKIRDCEKLQNITLPSRLVRLKVWNCRDLQTISVTGDFVEITKKLFIWDCAMLEELPMIDARSCVDEIYIDGCEKVKNIRGIKELSGLRWIRLYYCSNALILDYIHKLKNVPSSMEMIGQAVAEAESSLNEDVFYDANIGVDGVVEMAAYTTYPKWSGLSAVIFCYVVVLDASTSVHEEEWIKASEFKCFKVREGKWIITLVAFDDSEYDFLEEFKDAVLEYGIIKKGFRVEVKRGETERGEVCKSIGVLKAIVNRLHHS